MRKREVFRGKKGDIDVDTLIPWGIALSILVLMILGYIILKGKGDEAIEFIKNLFKFGSH